MKTIEQRIATLEKKVRVSITEAYKKLPSDERSAKFDFSFNFNEWEPP